MAGYLTGAHLSDEKVAAVEACMADGWPLIQIQRTHKVGRLALRGRWPDYKGMPLAEAAALGAAARRLQRAR